MKKHKLSEFYRGWLIGNFEPTLLKTEQFEVGLLNHPKGEKWDAHFHAIATEYNVLIKGKMTLNGELLSEGDVFVIEPNEIADPEFLEDCLILCVKSPSIPGDKYKVTDKE